MIDKPTWQDAVKAAVNSCRSAVSTNEQIVVSTDGARKLGELLSIMAKRLDENGVPVTITQVITVAQWHPNRSWLLRLLSKGCGLAASRPKPKQHLG